MKIVLIVYDKKKQDMVQFMIVYKDILSYYELYVMGMIGLKIQEVIGLFIECF